MKPRIGITLDIAQSGSFSSRAHYALRVHYFEAVRAAGGLPLAIAHEPTLIDDFLDHVDAVLIPGGGFASPRHWYEQPDADLPYDPSPRLEFDLAIIERALQRDMPLLGICAGMQLLAGLKGCKMTHDVHSHYRTDIDHMNGAPAEALCHPIDIGSKSKLSTIYGCTHMKVNSAHKEGVVDTPDNVQVTAKSPDGVIEAIELPDHRFAIGVQWHPEFFPNDQVIVALIDEASKSSLL